jgi:prophage antirepressor-like protein
MNEQLMLFKGKEVEVFEWNGKILFNPRNVGECLDIVDVNSSIRNFNEKQVIKLKNSDMHDMHIRKLNNAGENFITESGVYKLIFKSKKEEAEEFQDWVTDEVLPTLRRTGEYKLHSKIEENNNDYIKIEQSKLEQKAVEIFEELNEKTEELGEYFRPKHKTKLAFNRFIKDCLGNNATKENCKKAKDMLIMILGNGEYTIYEDIPLEKIKESNTLALLYDICKNINNSIVGGTL